MWLVELANKIHLAEYHMLYFFIFLLISGLYRMYDGRRRLLFEQQPDDRVNLIPDDDVVQLWHNLTKLNIKFGHFFQKYGLFLVVCAVVNILLFFKTYLNLQILLKYTIQYTQWYGLLFFSVLLLLTIFGILMISNDYADCHRRIGVRTFFLLNIISEKKYFFETYKKYNFYKRNNWDNFLYENDIDKYHSYGNLERYIFDDARVGKEKYIVIGSVIHYLSWLLLIILITTVHLILL